MSWCRWSCDRHRSDVYAYTSRRGEEVHVAGRRHRVRPAPVEWYVRKPWWFWSRARAAWDAVARVCGSVPIGGPCDGAHFTEPDEEALLDRLLALKLAGYHVPRHALDAVTEEIKRLRAEEGGP